MIARDVQYEIVYGDAMMDELEKIAGIGSPVASLFGKMTSAGKGRLAGTLVGAGTGAAGGAFTNPEDRTGGALRGALVGGTLGLAGGQVATRAGRKQVGNFGKRQFHGLTGYVPRTAQQKARGVTWTGKGLSKKERVKSLEDMGMAVGARVKNKPKAVQEAFEKQTLTRVLPTGARKRLAEVEVAGDVARRHAAEEGLTSIPGVAKAMVKNPLKTLKTGLVAQGPTGMFMTAVPTAAMLPGALKGGEGYGAEYSDRGGIARLGGETLGYAALGAVPLAPMIGGAMAVGKAGEIAYRKLRGNREAAGRIAR